jgi:phytoene synthase
MAGAMLDLPELTPPQRLALAYAPARARAEWETLLLLDARLASVVRGAREPVLAQIRLVWWRERLGEDPAGWPKGEPLLARLADWGAAVAGLSALVDGWEVLLAEGQLDVAAFAEGRVGGVAALARHLGVEMTEAVRQAARGWALADLSAHLENAAERGQALAALERVGQGRVARKLRPVAVLRVASGGGDWRTLARAIRVGIFGA